MCLSPCFVPLFHLKLIAKYKVAPDITFSLDETGKVTTTGTMTTDEEGTTVIQVKDEKIPKPDDNPKKTPTPTPVVKTGDEYSIALWVIMMLMALCAAGGLGIVASLKRRSR